MCLQYFEHTIHLSFFLIFPQVKSPQATINNEVAGTGPSGDSENREDEGQQGNEVGRGKGVTDRGMEPDLYGNTIDTGNSAAQLPQKNILERKEVLIGEENLISCLMCFKI